MSANPWTFSSCSKAAIESFIDSLGRYESHSVIHSFIYPLWSYKSSFFYTPIKDGTHYGITHGGRAASSSLSGVYLQDYISYGYEIFGVDRSHQGECSAHELYLLLAEFLSYCPLFIFILKFCQKYIPKTILAMVMKFCGWIDLIKGSAVHMNLNSCLLNF